MATVTKRQKALSPSVKAFIVEAVYEALNDPDRGLDLSEETKRRLAGAQTKQARVSLADVKKKLY